MDKKFSHLDNKGNARIVDISKKKKTSRYAMAKATVWLSKKILTMIKNDEFKKGNVINVARIAGIMGAKHTSSLIPLCHNINLDSSDIEFRFLEEELEIVSTIKSEEKTGVEMEALTAVTVSALTIYDMVKGVDKSVYIKNIYS